MRRRLLRPATLVVALLTSAFAIWSAGVWLGGALQPYSAQAPAYPVSAHRRLSTRSTVQRGSAGFAERWMRAKDPVGGSNPPPCYQANPNIRQIPPPALPIGAASSSVAARSGRGAAKLMRPCG